MVTQKDVFEAIRRYVDKKGVDYAKGKLDWFHKRLYALDLEGKVYFYAQDRDGIPVARAYTIIDGTESYSTMLVRNQLDAEAWENLPQPANWQWSAWPPKKQNDLLGCRSIFEHCAECGDLMKRDEACTDDDYFKWVLRKLDFWHKAINIRHHQRTGFGLYARKDIRKGTTMGEYTGMIVPWYNRNNDDKSKYYMQIGCGPNIPNSKEMFHCHLDGTERGSVFRFMNHSCEPNAEMREMRCGYHNRINVVVATRAIKADEQITISYGNDWFDDENPCYCRAKTCKYRAKKGNERRRRRGQLVRGRQSNQEG